MIRLLMAILFVAAVCSVGYGFWQTLEPIEEAESVEDARLVDRLLAPGVVTAPVANAEAVHGGHSKQAERRVETAARVAERVQRDVGLEVDSLRDIEVREVLVAVREEGRAALSELDEQLNRGDISVPRTRSGGIHPAGAPPPDGGGRPGTARQPGIDWYRGGSE